MTLLMKKRGNKYSNTAFTDNNDVALKSIKMS